MAKSSRLPSPEAYVKARIERRRKAEAVQADTRAKINEIIAWVKESDELTKTLEARATEIVEIRAQLDKMTAKLGNLQQSLTELDAKQRRLDEIDKSIQAIETADRARSMGLQARLDVLASKEYPKTDLSGVQRSLDALVARPMPRVVQPEPGPSGLTLTVASRDENGDIETVDVEVIRH